MPDHIIMHVQFDSGVTTWQCVLKQLVNILHTRGNSVNDVLRAERKLLLS